LKKRKQDQKRKIREEFKARAPIVNARTAYRGFLYNVARG